MTQPGRRVHRALASIKAIGITKHYGQVVANADVSLI